MVVRNEERKLMLAAGLGSFVCWPAIATSASQTFHIDQIVLSIAGPVIGTTKPVMNNIKHWGVVEERELEKALG